MENPDSSLVQEPSSTANPHLIRLRDILGACSKSVENGDISQSDKSVAELAECLNAQSVASAMDPDDGDVHSVSIQMLTMILEYISSPMTNQEAIDVLSFELPKALCKFSGDSTKYLGTVDRIIDQLVLRCSPRDMLSVLCEALDCQNEKIKVPGYVSPLLSGLSRVFISINRRHLEQIKVAVPLIFRALEHASFEEDDEDNIIEDLFCRAIGIATSIHSVYQKLGDELGKKLHALLGLYILQIMTYLLIAIDPEAPSCLRLVSQLSCFFQYCHLSYNGLITGSAVEAMSNFLAGSKDDEDDIISYFSYAKHGASLSVIWGRISDEFTLPLEDDVATVVNDLRHNQTKRWQAIGMLKHIFSSVYIPWRLKKHAIDFLHCITEGNPSQGCDSGNSDFSTYFPSIFAALQGIEMVMIYSPDVALRRKAFDALKRVIADIPDPQRPDMLKALIVNSNSSSMTALLLDCVREEMRKEVHQQLKKGNDKLLKAKDGESLEKPFWTANVVELINFVLRPSRGGPPTFPEESDSVLAALNLYRFILITESTGHTNCTGVLSETNLRKAYTEWLLPLRTLVTGIVAENKRDYDHDHSVADMVCALNPVELVLYRCIELVEEKLNCKVEH